MQHENNEPREELFENPILPLVKPSTTGLNALCLLMIVYSDVSLVSSMSNINLTF